jgi:hypothetical protein
MAIRKSFYALSTMLIFGNSMFAGIGIDGLIAKADAIEKEIIQSPIPYVVLREKVENDTDFTWFKDQKSLARQFEMCLQKTANECKIAANYQPQKNIENLVEETRKIMHRLILFKVYAESLANHVDRNKNSWWPIDAKKEADAEQIRRFARWQNALTQQEKAEQFRLAAEAYRKTVTRLAHEADAYVYSPR